MRILVVEDQHEPAKVLQAGLVGLHSDLQVACVSSAEEALGALESGACDLLIADVLLPGISGLELMARFRRRNAQTRVILLSGVQDPAIRRQIARSGADAFFFKPVEMADLLDAVERLLGLVKSSLPSELSVIANSSEPEDGLAQELAELRFATQAYSIALISTEGHFISRAGVVPDAALEKALLPHLIAAHISTHRAATLLGTRAEGWVTVQAAEHWVHLASLGSHHGLLLITKPLAPARSAALAEAVRKAVPALAKHLQEPADGPVARTPGTDPELEKLLDQAETKPTSRKAVERYWTAIEQPPLLFPGALSYAQASQIGLAPAEE